MHVCRHPTPSFGVRLIWRLCDQFPSDPPWSEPCWGCITTISLSHSVKTRGTVAGVQPSPFYLPKFPSNRAIRLNTNTAGMPGKARWAAFYFLQIVFLPYEARDQLSSKPLIAMRSSVPRYHFLLYIYYCQTSSIWASCWATALSASYKSIWRVWIDFTQ